MVIGYSNVKSFRILFFTEQLEKVLILMQIAAYVEVIKLYAQLVRFFIYFVNELDFLAHLRVKHFLSTFP